jgi:hypothetical protein
MGIYATLTKTSEGATNTTYSFRGGAMFRTMAAAVFALLTVTAPAHAAFVTLEDLNSNFGNGYQAIGEFGVLPNIGGSEGPFPTLYFDSSPLAVTPVFSEYEGHVFYGPPGSAPFGTYDFAYTGFVAPYFAPSTFADFRLNGVPAVSGTVSCISEEGQPCSFPASAATPLPPALPMFGAALLALGGFAWRSRRQQRG